MKGWQSACITDKDIFKTFLEGEDVIIDVEAYTDWLEDFGEGNNIEVFSASNAPGNAHLTGVIVDNLGFDENEILKIRVRRRRTQ